MKPEFILSQANEHAPQLVKYRRYLHAHPETGFDLQNTKEFVKSELQSMGYEPEDCGKCGLYALVGGQKTGPVFLLRADMDALPIQEETSLDFASKNAGFMHACGHDLHTAMLLGAARILKSMESDIHGTVKLMFQPAEELLEGAKDMIDHGILDHPKVNASLMIHVSVGIPLPDGCAVICDGGISAPSADHFKISIRGKGCHAAMPESGIDPVHIAAHIILGLQELPARELAISDPAVLTVSSIHSGVSHNVIPDTALLCGTLRTFDEKTRDRFKTRMKEICSWIAKSFRGTAELTFSGGCPTLYNHPQLSSDIAGYCKELLGTHRAFTVAELSQAKDPAHPSVKTAGSEDFSYVSHQVPSVMIALSAGNQNSGCSYPLHHPKTVFDENSLTVGSSIYAYTALRWLEDHS